MTQSVERATPGEEVPDSIPAVAAPYWLGRCHECDRLRQKSMVYQLCIMCGSTGPLAI